MLTQENIPYLYAGLGCKTAVGMPFNDIATSDSIFLRQLPLSTDTAARTALRRLVEVNAGLVVPADELEKDPLPNVIAHMDLRDAIDNQGKLPADAIRLAVTVDGTKSKEEIKKIKTLNPCTLPNHPI
mmetsp:Transcript_20837/g.29234  ORF Transcript_20837/g.29234 Transcript_20837/m.29234 type:complete len:128 (+) Transcript_20837:624-1007(+)